IFRIEVADLYLRIGNAALHQFAPDSFVSSLSERLELRRSEPQRLSLGKIFDVCLAQRPVEGCAQSGLNLTATLIFELDEKLVMGLRSKNRDDGEEADGDTVLAERRLHCFCDLRLGNLLTGERRHVSAFVEELNQRRAV